MNICHVTPHLPPDQAANALFPFHLGDWATSHGHDVTFITHPPLSGEAAPLPGSVQHIDRRVTPTNSLLRRVSSLGSALRITSTTLTTLKHADVVHLHSNGLLVETCATLAHQIGIPTVLTLYGTDIWHYHSRFIDPFTRMYKKANHLAFYSRGLLECAEQYGLARPDASVVYPPATKIFIPLKSDEREAQRKKLGFGNGKLLINVKRLHPLAGQCFLIDAMPEVLRCYPDTKLVICGSGPLHDELQNRINERGLSEQVTLLGRIDNRSIATYCACADLFVLPSLLEACPTVAVEALACGTPVVSSDNPGGVELNALFGDDVGLVPREQVPDLAQGIIDRLQRGARVTSDTSDLIERNFRPTGVWNQYSSIYERITNKTDLNDS